MQISNDYPVMVFRNDNEYGTFYKIGLSKKDVNGNYINGYKDVRFKKDVTLNNQTKIYIKKAWLDFYVNKDKRTVDYIFISEFETVKETIDNSKSEETTTTSSSYDPFEDFGNSVVIDDDFLD